MLKRKKVVGIFCCTLISLLLIVCLGRIHHGFFADEIDCEQIFPEDYLDSVNLELNDYEMTFSPQKAYFVGFEIYLINQPEGNSGDLMMTVLDEEGKILDRITVDLSKVSEATWYKVYTEANLKKDKNYVLRFSAGNCDTIPHLQNVNEDYLPDETVYGNVLISYAYAQETFSFQNVIIISMFIIAIWMFVCGFFIEGKIKKYSRIVAAIVFMSSVLTWNYMYNSMDNENEKFESFYSGADTLVTGMIYAEQDEIYFREDSERGYGLGRYYDLKGALFTKYNPEYLTNDYWLNGYSREENAIVVNSNDYSKEVAVPGNYIEFNNGEVYQITEIKYINKNIVIYLNSEKILTSAKNGSLDDVTFYDSNHVKLPPSMIVAYKSQYGLQGKVFKHMARYMDKNQAVENLHLICSIVTAIVFVIIVLLIHAKYNAILAGCFFVTFWLSPWIVIFARNLYWVEFTWFIPMAIGLFCAWKIESRKYRVVSYVLTLVAIIGKCLCGYEYISVIMMGLIAFPLVDLVLSLIRKEKQKSALLFRTIVILGVVALVGFTAAICIHALLRGEGSIIGGIKSIYARDVLRRTNGADLNNFAYMDDDHLYDLTASVWETLCLYFHFSTDIIIGITGDLFQLLCIIPLCIFGYEYKNKKLNYELITMYIVFFLASISWFCLAKSHSHRHTHLNYVLWYFGYVQICFYIIVNKIVGAFKGIKIEAKEGEK